MHRSSFDWKKAKKRRLSGSVEQRIFGALKKMIALRKEIGAFADFDNRQLLALDNPNLLVFSRCDPLNNRARVLVIGNFNNQSQSLPVDALQQHGFFLHGGMKDLCTGNSIEAVDDILSLPSLACMWLTENTWT
jgi:amylosucrase